jgi:translation initiation factor IF-1
MAKKVVAGTVDRVEGDVIVVVVKDPSDGINKEVYVKKKQLKKIELKEGDPVTVEMSRMTAVGKSRTVNLVFNGVKSGDMAKKFFTYLVDGGLEDIIIQGIAGPGVVLGISGFDKKTLTVSFEVGKEKPAKKAVKTPAKTVKAAKKKPVTKPGKSTKKG